MTDGTTPEMGIDGINFSDKKAAFSGLKPVGPRTTEFINQNCELNPTLRTELPNVLFRFEGEHMGFPQAILILPGLGRRDEDRERSKKEFRDFWVPNLSIQRSFVQVDYPDHTFVEELMFAQIADLATQYEIKEVDIIGTSFGSLEAIKLTEYLLKNSEDIKIKTLSLLFSGISKDDMTTIGKLSLNTLKIMRKFVRKIKIPSTILPGIFSLGARAAVPFEKQPELTPLPGEIEVKAFVAKKDEIFDKQKTVKNIRRLAPHADISEVSGGHGWDKERGRIIREELLAFLGKERGI